MKSTSITALIFSGVVVACATAILTWGFYGSLPATAASASVTLWLLTLVCLVLAWRIRERKDAGKIGMDRSQLSPLLAAQFLVIAKASAWTGALVGGAYLGIAMYVLPRAADLVAAAEDVPGVIASTLGGIALSAAGVYLERNCETPPPTDGEPA
ncbi:DUF3180 domain-containing protein [Corynebacterium hindlerae]|uniref:DUF3180 domain-containing protein n=1 Tax=Corynebacterium hindlerae TaxID=699041 RepID=UPI001AD73911|nr:DUF3180 domain-containing protein [Corynebacterium hindlerae]QTH59519.1 DUF3180 domain-containing protein [Corynebacterium hindlerae]